MSLIPFDSSHYGVLIDWIHSAQLNYLWGGDCYQFPLTKQQLEAHCAKQAVFPFLLMYEGSSAGYVELYQESTDCLRICRVFIAPQYRGEGLAKKMLTMLIEYAHEHFSAHELRLGVFEHNDVARRCYQSLGFKVDAVEQGTRSFGGETWNLVLMSRVVSQD